jgi:hypothetical protein
MPLPDKKCRVLIFACVIAGTAIALLVTSFARIETGEGKNTVQYKITMIYSEGMNILCFSSIKLLRSQLMT